MVSYYFVKKEETCYNTATEKKEVLDMHDMIKCLSSELRKSDVFQFIDEVAYHYQPLIELIPWDKEKINTFTNQNIYITYQCENSEIQASFAYMLDDWQVTCVISILDYGNKLVIENTQIRSEKNQPRIINTLTSLCYEESKYHENGSSAYYTITEDSALKEPTEESHIIFDYNGEVRSNMETKQVEKAIGYQYGKRKKKRK